MSKSQFPSGLPAVRDPNELDRSALDQRFRAAENALLVAADFAPPPPPEASSGNQERPESSGPTAVTVTVSRLDPWARSTNGSLAFRSNLDALLASRGAWIDETIGDAILLAYRADNPTTSGGGLIESPETERAWYGFAASQYPAHKTGWNVRVRVAMESTLYATERPWIRASMEANFVLREHRDSQSPPQ